MIQLPKTKRDPKEDAGLCKCRPICKSRRREWKGKTQKTSAELLLERKPLTDCFRRQPSKMYPNSPCPLFGKTRGVTIIEHKHVPQVVRICQAPIDDSVKTPYLEYARLAHNIGAWGAVKACCAFCECGPCCPCAISNYMMLDAERAARRRVDMREFDTRVKTDYKTMRIMYDKI